MTTTNNDTFGSYGEAYRYLFSIPATKLLVLVTVAFILTGFIAAGPVFWFFLGSFFQMWFDILPFRQTQGC